MVRQWILFVLRCGEDHDFSSFVACFLIPPGVVIDLDTLVHPDYSGHVWSISYTASTDTILAYFELFSAGWLFYDR